MVWRRQTANSVAAACPADRLQSSARLRVPKGTWMMAITVFIAFAGLMGAAGIALAAASAHAAPGAGLDSAAYMLLFHAAALTGGAALTQQGVLWRPLALIVLAAWIVGALLFSGDIAMRAFAYHRLFPFAAPSGGMILIGAWLALTVAAIVRLWRA
jgi:uncharacterized membrane protein YgdD (TMEM256/DUF423 family)